MAELVIDAADLTLYRDGTAELVLMGARPGDPTPRAVPLALPAPEARRMLHWLRRRGRVGMGLVWAELGRGHGTHLGGGAGMRPIDSLRQLEQRR